MVVRRHDMRAMLGRLIDLLGNPKPAAAIVPFHANESDRALAIDVEVSDEEAAAERDAAE
jgi:hypothetical protein